MDQLAVITRQPLSGPFFEFMPIDSEDEIVVFHELGVLRVDCKAEVKWSADAHDVITEWTNDRKGNVILTVMDGPALVVSLSSGAISNSP